MNQTTRSKLVTRAMFFSCKYTLFSVKLMCIFTYRMRGAAAWKMNIFIYFKRALTFLRTDRETDLFFTFRGATFFARGAQIPKE